MASAVLEEVETYVLRRHNTITQYITTLLVLEICLEVERRLGARLAQRWWEMGFLYLGGVRAAERAAESEVEVEA